MASFAVVEQTILSLCKQYPEGLSEAILESELSDLTLLQRAEALNSLLQKQLLQIFKQGDRLVYKEQDQDAAVKFKGLASEDMLCYQIIKASGNMGIWTRDLKLKSNLQQPQITKILKTLEGRRLVKAVKSVVSKNRKVYMLFELEPSREITGGAWYTEQEFDAEFIAVLRQQSLQYIMREGPVSLEAIADAVRRSGITKVDLREEDYQQIVNTLLFDGDIEAMVGSGSGKFAQGVVYYKVAAAQGPTISAFTSIPCGVCPVLNDCCDNGVISPTTCVYYQEWLQF